MHEQRKTLHINKRDNKMFWEADEDKTLPYKIPDDVIDINFTFQCKTLPLNHAWSLSKAILKELPWIKDEPTSGIHQIHVAESNNGWIRPDDSEEGALLYPSRRTKLTLRIPKVQIENVQLLSGKTLDIDGHSLIVGKSKTKELSNAAVIFARHITSHKDEDENSFLTRMYQELKDLTDVSVKKMLCGKSHDIRTPDGIITTRHLMIADLDSVPSIKIQQFGLGKSRELGCGLFLPHKGIKTLKPTE